MVLAGTVPNARTCCRTHWITTYAQKYFTVASLSSTQFITTIPGMLFRILDLPSGVNGLTGDKIH
jgi:hypothetical protein